MATITPPIPPAQPATATPAASLTPVAVAVTNVPANISQLTRQIDVSGLVSQAANGTFTLATALGQISLALPQLADAQKQQLIQQLMSLADAQKPLTVVLQPGSPPTQAVLLLPTVSNNPAAAATNNAASTVTQTPLPAANPAPPTQPVLPVATSAAPPLSAVVLPSGVVIPASANVTLAAPAVTAQPVAVPATATTPLQVTPQQTAQTQQAAPALAAVAAPPASANAPAPANAPPNPAALLQPGKEINLHIDAVAPPNTAVPPPAPSQLAATVIGNGPQGQAILKTGDATLYVRQSIDVPVGSNLLITIEESKGPQPALIAAADSGSAGPLQAVVGALAQANPSLAAQFTALTVPQPNAQLPGTLLFFLGALRQGDAAGWLGESVTDMLTKAGKADLIDKLTNSFRQAGQTVQDGTVGEWKLYPIPLQAEGQMQMLNLYVHGEAQRDGARQGGEKQTVTQTRFLIDVKMTRIGAVQIDGLTQQKKLDMIVRSENVLPQGLPQELREVYADTLSAIGYTGALNFQTGRKHWLVLQNAGPQSALM